MQKVEQVKIRMITYKWQWLKVQWLSHSWKNRQIERLQSLSVVPVDSGGQERL